MNSSQLSWIIPVVISSDVNIVSPQIYKESSIKELRLVIGVVEPGLYALLRLYS